MDYFAAGTSFNILHRILGVWHYFIFRLWYQKLDSRIWFLSIFRLLIFRKVVIYWLDIFNFVQIDLRSFEFVFFLDSIFGLIRRRCAVISPEFLFFRIEVVIVAKVNLLAFLHVSGHFYVVFFRMISATVWIVVFSICEKLIVLIGCSLLKKYLLLTTNFECYFLFHSLIVEVFDVIAFHQVLILVVKQVELFRFELFV